MFSAKEIYDLINQQIKSVKIKSNSHLKIYLLEVQV